jgi:hypothetical protein
MASTASPYGLRAVNELGGLPYAGSTRTFLIDPAGYNTNIFNGSIVAINTSGYINIVTTNGDDSTPFPAGTIGVFVGCSYYNAQGQLIFSQYYPANTTGVVQAFVIDDDRAVFQVQADGSVAQTGLGMNAYLAAVQSTSTGSTTTGNSNTALDASTLAATSGFAFRIVGFANVPGFSQVGDAYTDVLVKFNPGSHSYSNATGVA